MIEDLALVLPGAKEKRVAFVIDGSDLVTTTTTAGKTKATRKGFRAPSHAVDERKKLWRKKLREGFVHLNPQAAAFDLCFVGDGGSGGGGPVFDLSADGARVVKVSRDAGLAAWDIDVVNVDDGVATRLASGETPPGVLLSGAALDARGGLYFAVDDVVWHVAAGAPPRQVCAAGLQQVRLCFDRARRRLLVPAADAVLRVLDVDAGEATVCAVDTASDDARCVAAALSPSGRRVALYRLSRAGYDVNVIDVVDVDSGAPVASLPLPEGLRVRRLGFLPDDSALLLTWHMGTGPVCVDLDGKERWRLGDDTRAAVAHAWDVSHDGARVAVARAGPALCELDTRAERPLWSGFSTITHDVRFSADGRRVAAAVDGLNVVIAV